MVINGCSAQQGAAENDTTQSVPAHSQMNFPVSYARRRSISRQDLLVHLDLLGQGATGKVFRGTLFTCKDVAVKIVHSQTEYARDRPQMLKDLEQVVSCVERSVL